MVNNHYEIEKHLSAFAYNFLAKSKLKLSEYSVLRLILLRYADHKFAHAEKEPLLEATP
ncbi:MAG: hypothetical protein WCJ06_18085 [Planctomycetota bacterium]